MAPNQGAITWGARSALGLPRLCLICEKAFPMQNAPYFDTIDEVLGF